jgi:hypothetical protein
LTGDLVQPAQLFSNAELNPQNINGLGTFYFVTFYDANGARINKNPMIWQFTEAANSTVDISQMTAIFASGTIIYYPTTSLVVPTPTLTTLGGVFANAGIAHQWVSAINLNGTVTLTQPSFSDILGTISPSQIPTPFVVVSLILTGAAPTAAAGQLGIGATTAATATGGAATLPGNPLGFLIADLAGTTIKVPYYAA